MWVVIEALGVAYIVTVRRDLDLICAWLGQIEHYLVKSCHVTPPSSYGF